MKHLIILILFLLTGFAQAQMWQGTYQTQYGPIKLVHENGIYYGDYAGGGTVIAFEYYNAGNYELHGLFFNGNARGKFLWRLAGQSLQVQGFRGNYAYDNSTSLQDIRSKAQYFVNDFDVSKTDFQWTGKRTSSAQVTDLQTAVWSGKWKTNFFKIINS